MSSHTLKDIFLSCLGWFMALASPQLSLCPGPVQFIVEIRCAAIVVAGKSHISSASFIFFAGFLIIPNHMYIIICMVWLCYSYIDMIVCLSLHIFTIFTHLNISKSIARQQKNMATMGLFQHPGGHIEHCT